MFRHFFDEFDGQAVLFSRHIVRAQDADCQIFGHKPFFDCFDYCSFKGGCEFFKLFVVVKFSAMEKASSPSEN